MDDRTGEGRRPLLRDQRQALRGAKPLRHQEWAHQQTLDPRRGQDRGRRQLRPRLERPPENQGRQGGHERNPGHLQLIGGSDDG